jgi:hypothetical protein
MKAAADVDPVIPNLAGYDSNDDVIALAAALVYARTGDPVYREKAARAILAARGTENTGLRFDTGSQRGGLAVTVSRNIVPLVIAADLVDLAEYAPAEEERFRTWLAGLRRREFPDGSILANAEFRANNHGTMAIAARIAIAAYLGDDADLLRAATVFRGWLGDRDAYRGFRFTRDLSWQNDPEAPVGVNPPGTTKDGASIDGALPEEMRRSCGFRVPPCPSPYPWEGLQGAVVAAQLLSRQGFDAWSWEYQALRRSADFLLDLSRQYPDDGWWAHNDDSWQPWLLNHAYGLDYPVAPARPGKNMAWTDWLYGPGGEEPLPARVDVTLAGASTWPDGLVGQTREDRIEVRNEGPAAAGEVVLVGELTSGEIGGMTTSQGRCHRREARTIEYAGQTNAIPAGYTCELGALDRGASATVEVVALLARSGASRDVLFAGARSPDPRPANQYLELDRTVAPNGSLEACTVLGTPEDDSLIGTSGDDVLCGFGGADTVRAGAGDDWFLGDPGSELYEFGGPHGLEHVISVDVADVPAEEAPEAPPPVDAEDDRQASFVIPLLVGVVALSLFLLALALLPAGALGRRSAAFRTQLAVAGCLLLAVSAIAWVLVAT